MLSLGDLIQQQSQTSVDSPNQKRPRDHVDTPSVARKKPRLQSVPTPFDDKNEDDEEEEIELFFDEDEGNILQSTESHVSLNKQRQKFQKNYDYTLKALFDASANPTADHLDQIQKAWAPTTSKRYVNWSTDLERHKPRTKSKFDAKRKERVVITETPEQVRKRMIQYNRKYDRLNHRARWLGRKYDFTKEIDVGGAVERRARRLLAFKIRQEFKEECKKERLEEERQRDEREKEERRKHEERMQMVEDGNESIEEQRQVLDRLTQPQTQSQDEKDEALEVDESDPRCSQKGKMDYWERGATLPSKAELEFDYFEHDPILTRPPSIQVKDDNKDADELKATFSSLTRPNISYSCQHYYFQPNDEGSYHGRFLHWKQTESMAYRYLCSAPKASKGGDPTMENRMMRALQLMTRDSGDDTHLSQYSWKKSLLSAAVQRGLNIHMFYQKKWTDSEEVARQLDLKDMDPFGSSFLADRTLHPTTIRVFARERRRRLAKRFGLGNLQWVHNTKVVQEAPMEERHNASEIDQGEHSGNESEGEVTLGKTSAGVVADAQSNAPQNSSLMASTSQNNNNDVLLFPQSNYIHIPGSRPPCPVLPQDPVGIIFGPSDRHTGYYHYAKLDHTAYQLCISTLCNRVARLNREGESREIEKVRKQMKLLRDQYLELHDAKVYKRQIAFTKGAIVDVPLVPYFAAITHTCSMLANGFAETTSGVKFAADENELDGLYESDSDDDLYADDKNDSLPGSGMNEVANKIWKFLNARIDHNGLQRFPEVHIVYALCSIGRVLPKSAAEIFSCPADTKDHPTPLHIMKQTLEYLESKLMLEDTKKGSRRDPSVVRAAELEYLLHDASGTLLECLKMDALNLDYIMWNIACLAGCLLLCSGNYIGSGARRYPSTKREALFSPLGSRSGSLEHEVRIKMDKFEDTRKELGHAISLLLSLFDHQKGPKVHLAIVSLLEWKEMIALLVGHDLESYCDDITLLHRFHKFQWANDNPSNLSCSWKQLYGVTPISFLANQLENDPDDISNWRSLVGALGPLGYKAPGAEEHRKACEACRYLREPLILNHNRSSNWFGEGRDWWVESLLRITEAKDMKYSATKKQEEVLKKLEEISSPLVHAPALADDPDDIQLEARNRFGWLPSERELGMDEDAPSSSERSKLFDDDLPGAEPMEASSVGENCEDFCAPNTTGPDSVKFQLACYKILILCHLKGSQHPFVYRHVFWLVRMSKNATVEGVMVDSNAFRSLQWLYSMGLSLKDALTRRS